MTSLIKKTSKAVENINEKVAVATLMMLAGGVANTAMAANTVVNTKDVLSKSGITNYNNQGGDFSGKASELGATAINAGTIVFLVIGFFIFGWGILSLKDEQQRGNAGWRIVVGGALAAVGFAFGMFAGGFANLFGAK